MKKKLLAAAFISMLLLSALVGALFVEFGEANPYFPGEETGPPVGAKPPTIMLLSPENKTYPVDSILFSFVVNAGETQPVSTGIYTSAVNTRISEVHYEADWRRGNVTVYLPETDKYGSYIDNGAYTRTSIEFSGNLTDVPDGRRSITIYATEAGVYEGETVPGSSGVYVYQNRFYIREHWVINFTVDSSIDISPPQISVLSIQNKTYDTNEVPLNFKVDEPVSTLDYSLDGQDSVTIAGNTTLTGLPAGTHNITVYARDEAGNVGASETITFTIAEPEPEPEPFPTAPVIAASGVSVAVVSLGLLVYFKKRKR